jgi:hypothetical protein
MDNGETGVENRASSTPSDTGTGAPRPHQSRLPRSTSSLSERNGASSSTTPRANLPTAARIPQAQSRTSTPQYSMVRTIERCYPC